MSGRSRAGRPRGDGGASLVEMVVTVAVFGIVVVIVTSLFIAVSRTTAEARGSRVGVGTGVNALNEMKRVIRVAYATPLADGRTAPAVVEGSANQLTVTALVDTDAASPAPSRVNFRIDGDGTLLEDRTAGVLVGPLWNYSGATTARTLPGPLSRDNGPLFRYWDGDGGEIVANDAPVDGAPSLSPAQRATVRSITVTTTVATTAHGEPDPIVNTSQVLLQNLAWSVG